MPSSQETGPVNTQQFPRPAPEGGGVKTSIHKLYEETKTTKAEQLV